MPAFTQLCEKFNFSLFDDAITIYPKDSGKKQLRQYRLGFFVFQEEIECNEFIVQHTVEKDEFGAVRFVHRNDSDHDKYHQDGFIWDDVHIHAQFDARITDAKLAQILSVFVKYGMINEKERRQFQEAFAQVNAKTDVEQAFYDKLAIVQAKGTRLVHGNRVNQSDGQALLRLHASLNDAIYAYKLNKNSDSYQAFTTSCSQALDSTKESLNQPEPLIDDLTKGIQTLSPQQPSANYRFFPSNKELLKIGALFVAAAATTMPVII